MNPEMVRLVQQHGAAIARIMWSRSPDPIDFSKAHTFLEQVIADILSWG